MKETGKSVLLKIICFSGAICAAIWCCYEYLKNEDMCEVYFKRFTEDDESIYPDLTVLLPHLLDEEELKKAYGNNINTSMFHQNLIGKRYDDYIQNASLEKVIEVSQAKLTSCHLCH